MVVILCQLSSAKSVPLRALPFGPFRPQSFMLVEGKTLIHGSGNWVALLLKY